MKNFLTSLEICMLLLTLGFIALAVYKLSIEAETWVDNFEQVLRYGLVYTGTLLVLSLMHFIICKKIIRIEGGKKK